MRRRRGWSPTEPGSPPPRPLRSAAPPPPPPPPSGPVLGEALRIAAQNLAHRKISSLLLVLLIGFSVLSYLTTSLFAADTRSGMVGQLDLGLDNTLLVRIQGWAYMKTVYLDDPRTVEVPRTETFLSCLVTDEEGGELDNLRRHDRVEQVWLGRILTLQFPWGTDDLLSVQQTAPVLAGIEFLDGRAPAAMNEAALPEDVASMTGLGVGARVPYLATDPDPGSAAHSEGALVVTGIYRPGPFFFRGALGWLPSSYPGDYVTSTTAHRPRVLDVLEPNCYLIQLKPRASERDFIGWLLETWFPDSQGRWNLDPRYPVVSIWSDAVATEFLRDSLSLGTAELSGIIGLSLAFVGIGTLTILLLTFMERRREMAIMKAVGLTGGNIAAIFAMEVACLALVGMAIGLVGAILVMRVWLGAPVSLLLALRAAAVTGVVLYLSSMLPVAMARAATVTELLSGQRIIAVFRSRVSGYGGGTSRGFAARGGGA